MAYLKEHAPAFIHPAYELGDSGLIDCIHCTAQYGDGDNLASRYAGVMEWKRGVWERINVELLAVAQEGC
jgi:hypothetical protein